MEIKTTYTVHLRFHVLHDLHSDKILNLGQSKGESKKQLNSEPVKAK